MFLQVGHKRGPASANIRRIVQPLLALLVDIAPGVLQVRGAKPCKPVHAGIVGVTQSRLALIAPDHVLTDGGALFDGLDERVMCRRDVGTHFYEIGT